MKNGERAPKGFVECPWYERVAEIMRTDRKRFFLFSPQTKRALEVYLTMKARAQPVWKKAA